jgi:zinc transport system ATP-binding protein
MAHKEPVIELDEVSFAYNGVRVLDQVSLRIEPLDFVSIVGPNGGGKTTLLKLILGLITPEQGKVKVFGIPPVGARFRIGYMPQHSHLDPQFPVNVAEVVLMGRLGHAPLLGSYSREDEEVARRVMEELQIWDLRKRHFAALSGGQRQRTLIARALAAGPQLLLMDEPTAGLDVVVETEFHELLRSLSRKLTIVMVSHDLGFVTRLVNKVVCVKRKVMMHATEEISGALIHEIYGFPVKMVRHDFSDSKDYCKCLNS